MRNLRRWIPQHLFHHSMIRHPHGQMRPCLPANGSSAVWLTDWMNSRHPARSERDTSAGGAPVISSAPWVYPAARRVAAFFMTDTTKASRSTRAGDRLAIAASVTRTRRYDGRARSSPTARCAWSIAMSV